MPGAGYRLNPYEQDVTNYIQAQAGMPGAGAHGQELFALLQGVIGNATERRQTNLATRREGMGDLREMAMQLAASGADPTAVENAVSGLASGLPLMKGAGGERRTEGLMDYVSGLYNGEDISGLASPELRATYGDSTLGIDEEDRAAVGSIVGEAFRKGLPFYDIRELVRQESIMAGAEDPDAYVSEAERMYQEMTGVSLEDMRSAADVFRANVQIGDDSYAPSNALENAPEDIREALSAAMGAAGNDSRAAFGTLATDPGMFGGIVDYLNGLNTDPQFGGSWGLSDELRNLFFMSPARD